MQIAKRPQCIVQIRSGKIQRHATDQIFDVGIEVIGFYNSKLGRAVLIVCVIPRAISTFDINLAAVNQCISFIAEIGLACMRQSDR